MTNRFSGNTRLAALISPGYNLADASVATLAGTALGQYGEGFLRLSYGASVENIHKALDRIDVAVRKLDRKPHLQPHS